MRGVLLSWLIVSVLMPAVASADIPKSLRQAMAEFATAPQDRVIAVDIAQQRLTLYRAGESTQTWPISTATKGVGNRAGSEQTPLGWHRVKSRFGAGAAPGTIFEARRNTGRVAEIEPNPRRTGRDHVTSRILWLQGLERGLNLGGNVDSHARYIYIHGTHEEGLIGQPASHGCVRMRNADVIELFEWAPEGVLVLIRESGI
ncbi:MAG: L,D-transpeptidase family protein [Thiotrichales bacterium]